MKTLVFQFDNNYMFRLMQGAVWVDGQRLTIFKEKVKEKRVELPEGAKELVLTIEKYSSMPIAVANLPENQTHYFKVRSRVSNAFYVVAYVLFFGFLCLEFWHSKPDILLWLEGFMVVPFMILVYVQLFKRKGMIVVKRVEV
ncbi:hypothetical protein SAMN05444369_10959 [Capnocytophaga haemolytica]|jgi:hypothetical protein|uniref:Uncharacterized protein n=1 Tax=Capnocytophaga haemolytica TaxID=45243 RepID=A0AAX2GZJ5_9FLAO|nr:hypothetical protein [Capnocytophaga haemolytica]AMD84414.1 hypothetical protein AXF12_02000 [Capnocytophaga haemolytica]SFO10216.1 hypothetical protein SAMN05444369_10959 [Capnocytophaga haemolytica]SNV10697.1 Uncharacterised protein [Capnocytophaga haemolytica]